jgi:penicillin amidase
LRPRRRPRRIVGVVIGILAVAVGAVAIICWHTLPPSQGTLNIAGLSAPVAITLDGYGIPRIKAKTEADAAAALGYLHARDRMFQMDLMRRAASGRLSELAGSRALPLDRMSRTLGEEQHAERAYANLPADAKTLLVAYSTGVNAWITQRGRFAAPEFVVLGTPSLWRPVDSLLWNETVALWLSDNFRTELSRLALAGKLSPEKIQQLWPPQDGNPKPDFSTLPQQQGLLTRLPTFPDPFTLPSEASNAWAVDAHHTTTGAPLLAGDPHLALQFPSLWYLARIETPTNTLVGATAPGVPFLIIGRNSHIAWSFTTNGADTQDLFIETLLPGGQYVTPDGPRPFAIRQERIHVRDAPDVLLTIRSTRHGPVISDILSDKKGPILALEAAQYQRDSAAAGILALDRARTTAQAGQAATLIHSPVQNLTVADHDGIALFTTGDVPVRRNGRGTAPVEGADNQHDWTGYVSGDTLPHYAAPASGIVVNANERTAPPDFPVFMGADWASTWRARRIHQLLDAKPTQSIADFEAMQSDDVSVFARDLLPRFAALPHQPGVTGLAQELLAKWDGTMATELPQPLIFNAAIQLFVSQVIAANHVTERDLGPWDAFAAWLLTPEGGAWCDGDCRPALGRALHDAVENLAQTHATDPAAWRWGDVHKAEFSHPLLGSLPVIGHFASREVSVPGDNATLFRGGNGVLGAFAALHGAGYRGVYDLADLDRSRFVVTPGQSGNLFSAHAWDMLKLWAAGATITIPPSPDTVSARISLVP